MNVLSKILIFIYLFTSTIIYSQNITDKDVNSLVHGIVYYGSEQYLVTNKGYIKVANNSKKQSENDKWTEYYRKAYGDSTIQNPNTIVEQENKNIPIKFFLPISESELFDSEEEFNEDVLLYDFVERDENGNYVFRPGIIGIIGGMLKLKSNK